jgi:hypothetical protein
VADIITRLEAATGPFSGMDGDALARDMADALGSRMDYFSACLRALRGSLDAALALVGEKLPGDRIVGVTEARTADVEAHSAVITIPGPSAWQSFSASAPTPALAVLLALFRALQSSEPKDQDQ